MPQTVGAFVVSTLQLKELAELAAQKKINEAWDLLKLRTQPVTPAFEPPGFVMTVMIAYLEERGVALPLSEREPDIRKILETSLTLLACLGSDEARKFLAAVLDLRPTEAELEKYYKEFADGDLKGAGSALRQALEFLKAGAKMVAVPGQRLLLLLS